MFDPIPHYKRTGFRRDEDFQEISCHYDPALAGDARNAGLTKKLEKLVAAGQAGPQKKAAEDAGEKKVVVNQWATIYLYETKSLISGLSFQEDLAACTRTRPRAWRPRPSRRETPSTRSPSSRNASLTRRSSRRRSCYSSVQTREPAILQPIPNPMLRLLPLRACYL